ncbi:hypothetical protein [Marivivens marinus]|uniref:hypothetical protein n=1 Tax=Marivivens marinus TaxID=3110173 RepID=UPI003B84979F
MTAWMSFDIAEAETEYTHCDCCRAVTVRAHGDLSEGQSFLGLYTVTFAENGDGHPPLIILFLGDLTETAKREDAWAVRVEWRPEGLGVLDWDPTAKASIAKFTPLDRCDVIGTPFAERFWAMIDAIIMKDSRLKRFH